MGQEYLTVHALRSLWKPTKERLTVARPDHPTVVRLHRAFSWLARCEKVVAGQDDDLLLICLWVAFNGVYGKWDEQQREPFADRRCWREFLNRLLAIDKENRLMRMLLDRRELIMSILDDHYLSSFFWEEPNNVRAGKSKKAKYDARTWYVEKKWGMILDRLLERVYLLRCQLIHGAATFGGKLNRDSLGRCIVVLRHLLDAALLAVIEDDGKEDWGVMCYPPLKVILG
jgi:hypothetical protein